MTKPVDLLTLISKLSKRENKEYSKEVLIEKDKKKKTFNSPNYAENG